MKRLFQPTFWLVMLLGFSAAQARVLQHQDEALAQAFPPPAKIDRKTLFLDEAQARKIEEDSGVPMKSGILSYYVGIQAEKVLGYAYFDRHLVRTLPETIMVLLRSDGKVERISILSFAEPEDYLAKETWLEQFRGRNLDEELSLKKGIRNLTGASLTARAITQACRKVLAIHRQVMKGGSP